MVVRKVDGFAIFSRTTGRKLSKEFASRESEGLKKREKQIQFFKNVAKSTGTLRRKVRNKSLLR